MSRTKKEIDNRHFGRRQFLIGSGSSFLMLPPLLSLMHEKVAAAVASTPRRRAIFWTQKFGVNGPMLFPATQTGLTQQPGTHIYTKALSSFTGNISRLIDEDFKSLYPSMNLIQGLSLTGGAYAGHNSAALSSVHDGENDVAFGTSADIIMERSTGVYKPGEVIQNKAIRLITNGGAGDYQLHCRMIRYSTGTSELQLT